MLGLDYDGVVSLQGRTDMFFYEDDGIVLVDYKSDSVESMEKEKESYSRQLLTYVKPEQLVPFWKYHAAGKRHGYARAVGFPGVPGYVGVFSVVMDVEAYRTLGGDIVTDAAVIGSLGYVGLDIGESRSFICVDMSNELKTIWEYSTENLLTSPALFGDYVVFGAGSNLVTHHYSGENYTEIPVETEIIGSPFAGEYAI